MCGIAGILSTQNNTGSDQSRSRLEVMRLALMHRGPDGHGTYFASSGAAALCHTRLSIIDLSEAGTQPMRSQCGRYTITFNGEIYNYQQLRAQLENLGERFFSNSDTEVLLRLFQREGAKCVDKLRGMFAFLIWDEQEQSAFAARDPLGIKPFYYTTTKDGFFGFSSEVRSLISANLTSDRISAAGLKSYLLRGTVTEPNTLFEDIKLLCAGHTLTWKNGTTHVSPYWKLSFSDHRMQRTRAVEITRNALESTVKAHLISDVPVGIFLSGGIDSTALVALASNLSSARINTYSIAFESPEWNEGELAARVAKKFKTNHTEFLITPEIAQPLFDEFLKIVDQPTIDGFNTFCVSKLASDLGEKVVLSGVGSDELFAGYKSFETIPKMQGLAKRLRYTATLLKAINKISVKLLSSKNQRALDFLSHPSSVHAAHQSLRGIFSENEAAHLCRLYGVTPPPPTQVLPTELNTENTISTLELTYYMRNQLLRDSDVMSMACGLELRVPFVDRELIESVSQIPSTMRLEPGKKLLIDAVPELPDWVVNRPKQGFRFPFDEWFAEEWDKLPQPILPPKWLKLTPWYKRWSLLVLDYWLNTYSKKTQ